MKVFSMLGKTTEFKGVEEFIHQSIWCKTDFFKVLSDTKDFQLPLNPVY